MSTINPTSSAQLERYLEQINLPVAEILTTIAQDNSRRKHGQMMLAPLQAKLMCWLAKLIKAKKYLEIGVFTGYSSTAMALAMGPTGQTIACDVNAEFTRLAQQYWQQAGVADRITLYLQPASTTLASLVKQKINDFDMALIDADKMGTPQYIDYCYNLLRPAGILIIDNILRRGQVINDTPHEGKSIKISRQVNRQLLEDARFTHLALPIGDGMTLLIKN